MKITIQQLFFIIISFLVLNGCTSSQTLIPSENLAPDPVISISTETVIVPKQSVTLVPAPSVPMIAMINEEGIWLSDFEDEVKRYEAAATKLGKEFEEDQARDIVLETMIETLLLAQGARETGFILDQDSYVKKFENLVIESGGESKFQQWLLDHHYSPESFERLYKLQIEATWMRDYIIGRVSTRSEQIRARQILVSSKSLADDIYNQLQNGADFTYYAWGYDQLAGGELGWFPRDYLVLPQIEEVVFNLQPGEYSQVIESTYGYHIVEVMERELDRELTQDALLKKQRLAIMTWLVDQKANSSVILSPN